MKKSQEVSIASPEYRRFIEQLRARVISARLSAARAANREVILLYWDIGRGIVEKQQTLGWGDSIVEMVSADLRQAFPGSFGFSPQNVWRMLQFFRTHTDNLFLSQAVRELMGAVLAVAAKECQIVIFTCVPERYAFIGEAAVVPL